MCKENIMKPEALETKVSPPVKRGIVGWFNRVLDKAIDSFALVAVLVLVFIVVIVLMEIILRYFLNQPTLWTYEVTEYTLLWLTFLGTAWTLKEDGHVIVDLVPNALKPRPRNILFIVVSILGIIVCLIYTVYGIRVVADLLERGRIVSSVLRPEAWMLFIIIPLGNILLTLQFIRRTQGYFKKLKALQGVAQ
jgi:C4-dicarboxylate transporter DctQ subunit